MKTNCVNGLKGICCIQVSIGHMVALLLPSLYFGSSYQSHTNWDCLVYGTPIGMFCNAPSALMCFLLLSGFVIPYKKFTSGENISVLKKWGKKYLRLMPMAFIGIFFGWIIMKAGLVYSYKMVDLSYSYGYAVNFNNFYPKGILQINGPIWEALVRVFLVNSQINSPLGTLKYIWQYSLILLLLAKYNTGGGYKDLAYGISVLASLFAGQYYKYEIYYLGAMILGMWICDMMYNPLRKKKLLIHKKAAIIILIVAIGLLSIPGCTPEKGMYNWIAKIPLSHALYYILGWALLLIAVKNLKFTKNLLTCKLLTEIGRLSFAYYVIHWPFIISFTCISTLILYNYAHLSYVVSSLASIFISIPIMLIMAWIVENYIYKYLLNVSRSIAELIGRKKLHHE